MKEIIKLSFGSSKENFDQVLMLNGQQVHVRGIGVNYDFDLALEIVKRYSSECDAFALSGFILDIKHKQEIFVHKMVKEIRDAADGKPVLDGNMLRKAAIPWALKKYLEEDKHFLSNKTIAFYNGLVQWNFLSFFEEYQCRFVFGDLYFSMGIPISIEGMRGLETFLNLNSPFLTHLKLTQKVPRDFNSYQTRTKMMRPFLNADLFFVTESQLKFIELNDLTGKTVIIDRLSAESEEQLMKANVSKILNLFPTSIHNPNISSSVIEAMLYITHPQGLLAEEDILNNLKQTQIKPQMHQSSNPGAKGDKFAFIIHPLSKSQIAQIPGLEFLKKTPLLDVAENIASKLPGYHYCKITGIKSDFNGKEVEGDLFLIPSTPKMLLSNPTEKVYDSLTSLCELAHKRGARLIGLGAYTKIVGDAGVTINQRSPIPVTTGNSLSSAATLWAASYGIDKMDLVEKKDQHYQGTCMIIGATGSIGKICAKILSKQWKRIIVVAPRPYKVLELVEQLQESAPETEIIGTTNPNKYSSESDLIITSTSAQGEKILDIELVKPGCVICDVSRPFDISLDDAAKRPDVLIIASGEVELPGQVKIEKTIGLEGETVYACLAETALLTMEGIFESFSISRELSYEKVVQIDRLSRKHGIRLSSIMGHTGEISESEIASCRTFAIKSLKAQKLIT
jgi:predicted amino acid dehydrogenase